MGDGLLWTGSILQSVQDFYLTGSHSIKYITFYCDYSVCPIYPVRNNALMLCRPAIAGLHSK